MDIVFGSHLRDVISLLQFEHKKSDNVVTVYSQLGTSR